MFVLFSIKDAIDILLVALLLFNIYKLMKESGTITIFTGVLAFLAIWILVSKVLDMRLIGSIMDKLVSVGMVALVVLFQDEIRRFLVEIGSRRKWRFFFQMFLPSHSEVKQHAYIMPVVMACINLSKNKTGALIVIQEDIDLKMYEKSGEQIDAEISSRLIENIFFKNSPLHDGAIIIANNRISAAACILPVSHSIDIPKLLGLRHRSALGISQESDAKAIIVSEETGNISLAHNGKLHLDISAKDLENLLANKKDVIV